MSSQKSPGSISDSYPEALDSGPDTSNDSHSHLSAHARVLRYTGDRCEWADDDVAVEEPLQIRLAGEDVAVTMRTPGHDHELATGFLFAEGIIQGKHHIEAISYCQAPDGSPEQNIINVLPTDRELLEPGRWGRNFISSSSCGLCGKTSIEQVRTKSKVQSPKSTSQGEQSKIPVRIFYELEASLRAAQETFTRTGGLHAAALFTLAGDLLVLREDVGRHNAVDKVIGHALLNDWLPLEEHILVVSSRASFEIVQKAHMAGVEVVAVFSAPSSLAINLAREADMTLVAFLRQGRLNVYAGTDRVTHDGFQS